MPQDYQCVLIVDDSAGIRHFLYEIFCNEGYMVEIAASGAEAIKKVCARAPTLIFLDFKMPDMNGLEVIGELKKIAPQIPIVMMTAYSEQLLQLNKYCHIQCISKPFDLNVILEIAKGILFSQSIKEKILAG